MHQIHGIHEHPHMRCIACLPGLHRQSTFATPPLTESTAVNARFGTFRTQKLARTVGLQAAARKVHDGPPAVQCEATLSSSILLDQVGLMHECLGGVCCRLSRVPVP